MLYKLKSILPDTLQTQPKYFIGISFVLFLKDEDFISKTINEGCMDLDKFPTSRVCQLAKKMESSKATARHIKQVAGDPQMAQINLMWHQCAELPNGKYKKKINHTASKGKQTRRMVTKDLQINTRRPLILDRLTKTRIDVASAEILLILKGSNAQPKIPVQGMLQVWSLHKPLLPKSITQTIQLQAQDTHCASIESWYYTCT